eukprot:161493-Pelagomonas_calceolata.AAC.2
MCKRLRWVQRAPIPGIVINCIIALVPCIVSGIPILKNSLHLKKYSIPTFDFRESLKNSQLPAHPVHHPIRKRRMRVLDCQDVRRFNALHANERPPRIKTLVSVGPCKALLAAFLIFAATANGCGANHCGTCPMHDQQFNQLLLLLFFTPGNANVRLPCLLVSTPPLVQAITLTAALVQHQACFLNDTSVTGQYLYSCSGPAPSLLVSTPPLLQANALTAALAQHQALREAAAPSRDAAFMAAYKSFLQLVAAEEERAAAHPMTAKRSCVCYLLNKSFVLNCVNRTNLVESYLKICDVFTLIAPRNFAPQRTEAEEHDANDRADEIHRARLDHLYAQLRAFVRKYLPETAAIAPQLAQELRGLTLPPRASEVLQEVLKCEL